MTKEEEAIKFLELHTGFMGKLDKGRCIRIPEKNFTKTKQSIETLLNMLKEKDKEIKKKDKIIDLLVNKLNQDCKVFENGEIKEIVEIYEKIKSTSDLRGIELRKECIKQYFERKATNDG